MDARARTASRALFAGVLVLLSIWIAQGFLAPIGWAAVIAITTWPLYRRFTILLASQRDSIGPPLVFTLLIGLVLLVPVGLAAHRATQETEAIGQSITHYRQHGIPAPEWLPSVPCGGKSGCAMVAGQSE